MESPFTWNPVLEEDIDAVDQIANIIHPGLPERKEVFAEKLRLFPAGCMKFIDLGCEIVGYGVAHPWKSGHVSPLDEFLGALPKELDSVYLHDIAILPEARGHNGAGRYVDLLRGLARNYNLSEITCVSVYGTAVLWEKHGFRMNKSADMKAKVKSYGETAYYMTSMICV